MKILVTGASYGMGKAISLRLAPKCSSIFLHGRNTERLEDLSGSISGISTAEVNTISQELSEQNAAQTIADQIREKTEHLDAVILNAGFYREGSLSEVDPKQFEDDFRANVHANIYLVKELMPLIQSGERRRIVITGSTAGYEPYPLVPEYGVQKWALRGYALNLRNELRSESIGVTFLAPGATWTGMWEGEDLPDDRLLEADDIAKSIEFLLSLSPQAVVEELKIVSMLGDIHE